MELVTPWLFFTLISTFLSATSLLCKHGRYAIQYPYSVCTTQATCDHSSFFLLIKMVPFSASKYVIVGSF